MAGHVHVRDIRRPVGAEVFAASLVFQHHVVGWGKALGLEVEGQLWRNVRLSGLRRIWLIDLGVGRVRPIERVIFRVAPGRGEQVVIGPGRVEMVLKSCPEELGVVFRIADDVQPTSATVAVANWPLGTTVKLFLVLHTVRVGTRACVV